jgi:tricorn protease-like protein
LLVKAEGDLLYHPQILPGGKSLLYTLGSSIVVQSLESGDRKELFPGYRAQFLSTGHLIYGLENNLYAVPFDHNKLVTTGDPFPMLEDRLLMIPRPQYAVSKSGTLLYLPGSILNQVQLQWYDRRGSQIGSVGDPAHYQQFSLSPDEKRAILSGRNTDGSFDLWVLELDRSGIRSRFTSDEYSESDPIWSPDGNYVMFRSNRKIPDGLYRKSFSVEEEATLVKESEEGTLIPEDWSENFISYLEVTEKGQKICLLPLSSDRDSRIIAEGNFNYDEPKFSPDGRWLAYVSSEAEGISDVYILQLEGKGLKRRISTKGGVQPQWREDGKELFYLDFDGSMIAVELKGETLEPGDPKTLFQSSISVDERYDQYAVTGDGEKFLLLSPLDSGDVSSINIVLNWFEELKERVPVD